MARIGLIDVDSRNYPNLALMKISSFHKAQGDTVEWYNPWGEKYDLVYKSKIFSFTPDYNYYLRADKVISGGTGYCISNINGREVFDGSKNEFLPGDIEHSYPDYNLYPKYTDNTAYGFLTRGCPRGCKFCIVGMKEGLQSHKVANLEEFWRGQKNIVLNDPNILACKDWKELLTELRDSRANIDFNQGLDIRLMTEEKAQLISEMKIKEIHFAWDRYGDRDIILPKLKLFADVTKTRPHGHNAIVYTITNFGTTIEQDLERIYTLRDMGYWAYVMIYDKEHCKPIYKDLQGWCNNRIIFGACKNFNDYKRSNI